MEGVDLDRWSLDSTGPTYVVPRSTPRRGRRHRGARGTGAGPRPPETATDILQRATRLVPELAGARVVGHRVGLRPAAPRGTPGGRGSDRALLRPGRRRRDAQLGVREAEWSRWRLPASCHRRDAHAAGAGRRERTHTRPPPTHGRMRRMARDFKTIGVVGLGTMGAGITEVFARNGYTVVGVEIDDEAVSRGRQHLETSTSRAVARGKLSEEEQKALLDRVTFATSLEELKDADLVVEAVVESVQIKKQIFKELDAIVSDETILATNTSSLSVTEISTSNRQPGPCDRRALLQPCAGAGVRRDRPDRGHRAQRPERRLLARADPRQEPRRVRRQGGVHREHAALRLPQPRRVDVREPLRLPRGHRCRDALRVRLPDGSAGPAGPDRPGHGVRDPRHDVPPGT